MTKSRKLTWRQTINLTYDMRRAVESKQLVIVGSSTVQPVQEIEITGDTVFILLGSKS